MNSTTKSSGFRQIATKEIALLSGLLFVGLVLVPIAVFFVGQAVFGTYGGVGYSDFFATLRETASSLAANSFAASISLVSLTSQMRRRCSSTFMFPGVAGRA